MVVVLIVQQERLNPGFHSKYPVYIVCEKAFRKNENKGAILNGNYRFFKRVS